MPICDNCGMGLPVGYEYCFKCGYPVRGLPAGDADPAGAAAQQPPPPGLGAAAGPFAGGPQAGGYQPAAPGSGPAAAARTQVLASWQSRLGATLIDYAVVSAAIGLVAGLSGVFSGTASLWSHGTTSWPVLVLEGALLLAFAAYNMVCEAVFGATLGKRLLGLRVVAYGGGRAGIVAVVVRNLTKVLSCLVWPVGVPVAMFAVATNADHQRLGDRLAGTYVLHDVVTFVAPGAPR